MFDENKNNNVVPPNNLPLDEPEDMFAEVDKKDETAVPASATKDALSAGVLQPKQPGSMDTMLDGKESDLDKQAGSLNQISKYKMKGPSIGKILLSILAIIIIAGVAFGAWWVYTKVYSEDDVITTQPTTTITTTDTTTTEDNTTTVTNTETVTDSSNTTTQINNQITADEILFGEPVDTDGDGLDDIREKTLGTDVNKKDTDGDGLTDGDEFFIWKTDPTNKDTDGDTYPDGDEIKFGYSPLGPGKLINIPTSATKTTSTN